MIEMSVEKVLCICDNNSLRDLTYSCNCFMGVNLIINFKTKAFKSPEKCRIIFI